MSFVPIPNGKVQSVVNLVQLNKDIDRPTRLFSASKDIASRMNPTIVPGTEPGDEVVRCKQEGRPEPWGPVSMTQKMQLLGVWPRLVDTDG